MVGGTGIQVLWYREGNTTNTAVRNIIWPKLAPKNVCSLDISYQNAGGNGTKRPIHVRQKRHRTRIVLALSSSFVNREKRGNVVAES